jgi:hypothetical protein
MSDNGETKGKLTAWTEHEMASILPPRYLDLSLIFISLFISSALSSTTASRSTSRYVTSPIFFLFSYANELLEHASPSRSQRQWL